MVARQLLDALFHVGLTFQNVPHVTAFVFDQENSFEVALKRLDRELKTRKLSRHAHRWGLPIQRHEKRLLDVIEYLVLHARGGDNGISKSGHNISSELADRQFGLPATVVRTLAGCRAIMKRRKEVNFDIRAKSRTQYNAR